MAVSTGALLRQALELPDGERESLPLALLDSLHGPRDDGDIEGAWAAEIRRRVEWRTRSEW